MTLEKNIYFDFIQSHVKYRLLENLMNFFWSAFLPKTTFWCWDCLRAYEMNTKSSVSIKSIQNDFFEKIILFRMEQSWC